MLFRSESVNVDEELNKGMVPVVPVPPTVPELVAAKDISPAVKEIVIPEPAEIVLYSNVVPAPTTPRTVLLEPTEVKPVPPLVEARVPET